MVYRVDYEKRARKPIEVILERRRRERAQIFFDLLQLTRRRYAE